MATPSRWEVVGGGAAAGIVVRQEKGTTSVEEATRLRTGALVQELELVGDRLRYSLLAGVGPTTGRLYRVSWDPSMVISMLSFPFGIKGARTDL